MHHSIPPEIHLKTPFLCEEIAECNEENFFEFHQQHGFDVNDIVSRGDKISTSELDRLAAFLQAWFVFGLIRQVLHPSGIHLDLEDFVYIDEEESNVDINIERLNESDEVDDSGDVGDIGRVKKLSSKSDHAASGQTDGVKMVMTDRITQYMLYWIASESQTYDPDRKQQLNQRHMETFQLVEATVNKLISWRCQYFSLSKDGPTDLDDVILSVILLVESLCDVSSTLFNDQSWELEWELDHTMKWFLMDAGWCPGEVCSSSSDFK